MSIVCEFVSSKCINTRNSKSSGLFGTNMNNKKQKYIKKINVFAQNVPTLKSTKETKYQKE